MSKPSKANNLSRVEQTVLVMCRTSRHSKQVDRQAKQSEAVEKCKVKLYEQADLAKKQASQPANQPTNQFVKNIASKLFRSLPSKQPSNEPTNQPTNQPAN